MNILRGSVAILWRKHCALANSAEVSQRYGTCRLTMPSDNTEEEPPQKRWRRDEFAHHLSEFDQELLKREEDEEEKKFLETGIRSWGMVITCDHGVPNRWICQTCVKEAITRIEDDSKPKNSTDQETSSSSLRVYPPTSIPTQIFAVPAHEIPKTPPQRASPKSPPTANSVGLSTIVFSTPDSESKHPSEMESTQEWGESQAP